MSGVNSGAGTNGNTGWIGAFRSHLYLATPKPDSREPADHDTRVLTRGKANFARRGDTIEMRWRNGVFEAEGPAPGGVFTSIEKQTCDDVFLRLLQRLLVEGRHVSDRSRGSNYAPRTFAQQPDRERFKETDFAFAMLRLFAAKSIRRGSYKDASRRPQDCILPVENTP